MRTLKNLNILLWESRRLYSCVGLYACLGNMRECLNLSTLADLVTLNKQEMKTTAGQ